MHTHIYIHAHVKSIHVYSDRRVPIDLHLCCEGQSPRVHHDTEDNRTGGKFTWSRKASISCCIADSRWPSLDDFLLLRSEVLLSLTMSESHLDRSSLLASRKPATCFSSLAVASARSWDSFFTSWMKELKTLMLLIHFDQFNFSAFVLSYS